MHSDLEEILSTWETVYKRGLLSFWVLLLLHDRSSYPYEMNQEIEDLSKGTMSVDGNSIYRILKRFEGMGLVKSEIRNSDSGPDRRYYSLSSFGLKVLKEFTKRNLLLFQDPEMKKQLDSLFATTEKSGT